MPMPFKDKTGQIFGFWAVLEFAGRDKSNHTLWKCKCICGTERVVVIGSLMGGYSKSCGCNQYQVTAEKNTDHGMAGTPTYKSWHAMKQRCEGKGGHESYPARGISMCKEWEDFSAFFLDMGTRPSGMTLDRIDNTKGYFLENCRWATYKQQANNKKDTVYVTVDGKNICLTEACKKYGIGISCARHRLRKGMPHQQIFTTPSTKSKAMTKLSTQSTNGVFIKE